MSAFSVIRRMVGLALIGAGAAAFLYLLLVAADLAAAWWAYSTMSSALRGHGLNKHVALIVGAGFAILFVAMTDGIFTHALKRKTMQVVIRVSVLGIAAAGVMYYADYPYVDSAFDIFEGKPKYKYYTDPDGQIVVVPMGAKVGPQGQALRELDEKSALEHDKQEKARAAKATAKPPASNPVAAIIDRMLPQGTKSNVLGTSRDDGAVNYWVEQIRFSPNRTEIRMAAKRAFDDVEYGQIYRFREGESYLADPAGRVYVLVSTDIEYTQQESNFWDGLLTPKHFRMVRPAEIFHFSLYYQPVQEVPKSLDLYDPRFYRKLNLDWELGWADATPLTVRAEPARSVQFQATQPAEPPFVYGGGPSLPSTSTEPRSVQFETVREPPAEPAPRPAVQEATVPEEPIGTEEDGKPPVTELPVDKLPGNHVSGVGNLVYWVEKITFHHAYTSVHMACSRRYPGTSKLYVLDPGIGYLNDETGKSIQLVAQSILWNIHTKQPSDMSPIYRVIPEGETYRFTLDYAAMKAVPTYLKVYDPRFGNLDLTVLLPFADASKITGQARSAQLE